MFKDRWKAWQSGEGEEKVVPLLPENVEQLKLGWNSYFRERTLEQHLREQPGLSFQVEGTKEYIIGDYWRHRQDIGYIVEVGGRRFRTSLVSTLLNTFRSLGCRLVIVSQQEQVDNLRFYREFGFKPIERVIYYELRRLDQHYDVRPVDIVPYTDDKFDELVALDNQAFPWLWWNNAEEFEFYIAFPNVQLYLAMDVGKLVGYFSCSLYRGWGHLDRLAVAPEAQGKGFGAAQLAAAVYLLHDHNMKRMTLTTQEENSRSRKLYESFGFLRPGGDYWINGLWLDNARAEE